jgi:hypothetical protein
MSVRRRSILHFIRQELPVSSPEISAARHDVIHAREKLSDTINEIEHTLTAPVRAVTRRLDVGRLVQEHPWAALAVAMGTGALVASSGADAQAASVAAERARQGAAAGLRLAREGGAAGVRVAREAPTRSRGAIGAALDAVGVKLVMSVVDALREPRTTDAESPAPL